MTADQWFALLAGSALLAFIIFAFRQGSKVKPRGRQGRETIPGETTYGGQDGGPH